MAVTGGRMALGVARGSLGVVPELDANDCSKTLGS